MIPSVEDSDLRTYVGFVLKVDDPRGEHRLRVEIPGLTDDVGWARPRNRSAGYVVPRVGDRVQISYEYGNTERPLWEPAGCVSDERPADVAAAGTQAHLVHAFEIGALGSLSFRITLDEREGSKAFRIYAVDTANDDDLVVALELDLENRGVILYGLTGVEIRSTGFIQLTAALLQINNRAIAPSATPI